MSGINVGRELVVRVLGAVAYLCPARPRLIGRERILLIRPDHLGDIVLATAVLRGIRVARPSAEITMLVGPWAAQVLRTNADVDRVLTFAFPWFDRQPAPSPIEPYFVAIRLAARLRAYSFDRVYILRPDHWWGALVAQLANVPQRIGYAGALQSRMLTKSIPLPVPEHAVVSGLRLADPSREHKPQFETGLPLTTIRPTLSDRAIARQLLDRHIEVPSVRLAIIHPGASVALKRWPVVRWAAIADRLSIQGWSVAIAGGPGEGTIAEEIRETAAAAANLGEVGSIGVLAALFESAGVAFGMDSAPMHVATAVGTPTIRLFGPGNEFLFGPWGDARYHRFVRAPGTAPDDAWFGRTETTHPTIDAITVDMVWRAFEELTTRHA